MPSALLVSHFNTMEGESRVGGTFSWRIASIHVATVRKSSAVGILCRFRESLEKVFETQVVILFLVGSSSGSRSQAISFVDVRIGGVLLTFDTCDYSL